LHRIKADPSQIEQVIMNLVVNARDALPTGGKLVVELANVEIGEAEAAEQIGIAKGPHVLLAVSDSGIGMNKETLARIFEPFFTTKANGKGTGLGLSTVFGIVKQSGGSISVYSEPGKGTTFKIYLPVTNDEARSDAPAGLQAPTDLRGRETILLVEDDAQVRVLAADILRRQGYRLLESGLPSEALALVAAHPGPIHLLLTDVVMPEMSGRVLAEQLGAKRPSLRVLFMSGYTDDAIVHHGVLESGVAFIQKPLTPEALARRVRQALDAAGPSAAPTPSPRAS
jgi:two-component system cell cycle sensor histidine kinase/response regulator CckA